MNVIHFAASVDTVDANTKFAQSLGINYPILSDPTKAAARAYGVLTPAGYASRTTFYIGTDGQILYIDRNVSAASHGADVTKTLKTLGF